MATLSPHETKTEEVTSSVQAMSESSVSLEKTADTQQQVDLEIFGEQHGYALDETVLKQQLGLPSNVTIKKDSTGRVLIPQPSDDPRDPLNWSPWKKRSILIMLAVASFTCDYSAATGASALLAQAEEWHISPNTVNHATAGNTFMLGIGGLCVVWLSARFGRLPVLFWWTLLASATAIWSAVANSFESYMASRILNGFFVVAAAGGGLMWINDCFFFHERPRIINIWSCAIILSPFLGPQLMAAIIGTTGNWRIGMYLNFAIITTSLILITILGRETFYPRHLTPAQIPDIQSKSHIQKLLGIAQAKTNYTGNNIITAGSRTAITASRLPVILICLFYFFDFGWTIANNTTISVILVPEYSLGLTVLAVIYVAPVLGAFLGIPIGHYLFDFIGKLWAKRHNGVISPEARLIPIWLVLPLKIAGYNMIGMTMGKHLHISIMIVGWAMHNFATVMTTAAVGAYLIDCYPEASGESAAWINFSRTLAGFVVGYIQLNWAVAAGPGLEYGIQTAIMGAAFILFVVPLTLFGNKIRKVQKPLKFTTN